MNKKSTPPAETNLEEDQEAQEDLPDGEQELDEVEVLTSQLARQEEKINKMLDDAKRSQAEMENYRKRIRKENSESVQYANEKFLREIIPISDDLDRAISASNVSVESLKEGVEIISRQFHDFLKKFNVKPIAAKKGKKFDPSVHEAISWVESEECEESDILEEYSKGYYLNSRVLIPAKVVIAKKPADSSPAGESSDDEAETAS